MHRSGEKSKNTNLRKFNKCACVKKTALIWSFTQKHIQQPLMFMQTHLTKNIMSI